MFVWRVQHLTGFIQVVVHVDMLEWVPGVFALLCAVENQSHQVPVTTDDFTGVDTAHDLQGQNTDAYYHENKTTNEVIKNAFL